MCNMGAYTCLQLSVSKVHLRKLWVPIDGCQCLRMPIHAMGGIRFFVAYIPLCVDMVVMHYLWW